MGARLNNDEDGYAVPENLFSVEDAEERTGSTNERVARGRPLATWRSQSVRKRYGQIGLATAICGALLVVPLMIGTIGALSRVDFSGPKGPNEPVSIEALDPRLEGLQQRLTLLNAVVYGTQSLTPTVPAKQLTSELKDAREALSKHDAAALERALGAADEAMLTEYGPAMPEAIRQFRKEFWQAHWRGRQRLAGLADQIQLSVKGRDLPALLSQLLVFTEVGAEVRREAQDDPYIYEPPVVAVPKTPEPTPTATPEPTPAPTEAPKETKPPEEPTDPESPGPTEDPGGGDKPGPTKPVKPKPTS